VADLGDREWQARAAKFVLGAANRPVNLARPVHAGHAFFLVGLEAGRVVGTSIVDPAVVGAGLARFLGTVGPSYHLDYVTLQGKAVAVITVLPTATGHRPYVARGTFSGAKLIVQDGRIYVRRTGLTEEATSAEVDDMLVERVAARFAAGPRWPMQPVEAWRDGRTIHVRKERGDNLAIHEADLYTNLGQMTRERPDLPPDIPEATRLRIEVAFDPLILIADSDPGRAVDEAWPPLRQIAIETYQRLLSAEPPSKVIDMVTVLANERHVEGGWVDVAYPLYYWAIVDDVRQRELTPASARCRDRTRCSRGESADRRSASES
jgi:hypothetical protein